MFNALKISSASLLIIFLLPSSPAQAVVRGHAPGATDKAQGVASILFYDGLNESIVNNCSGVFVSDRLLMTSSKCIAVEVPSNGVLVDAIDGIHLGKAVRSQAYRVSSADGFALILFPEKTSAHFSKISDETSPTFESTEVRGYGAADSPASYFPPQRIGSTSESIATIGSPEVSNTALTFQLHATRAYAAPGDEGAPLLTKLGSVIGLMESYLVLNTTDKFGNLWIQNNVRRVDAPGAKAFFRAKSQELLQKQSLRSENLKVGEYDAAHCKIADAKAVPVASLNASQVKLLRDTLQIVAEKSPALVAAVLQKGFSQISVLDEQRDAGQSRAASANLTSGCFQIHVFLSALSSKAREADAQNAAALGYSPFARILAHEMFHVIDANPQGGFLTDEPGLQVRLGFHTPTPGDSIGYRQQMTEEDGPIANIPRDRLEKIFTQAIAIKQRFGEPATSLYEAKEMHNWGFPSLYAATSVREAFAEFGSFLVFDPDASLYVSKDLVSWFQTNIPIN